MYLEYSVGGKPVALIMRQKTEERLGETCFRGPECRRAGNFFRYRFAEEFFSDSKMQNLFFPEIWKLSGRRDFDTHSFSLDLKMEIGWESTAPLQNYETHDLEEFTPNRRSSGLRVKSSKRHLLAPRTSKATIVYELKEEFGKPVVVVHSLYPGVDIGELEFNVTKREQRVFFDFNHPGA